MTNTVAMYQLKITLQDIDPPIWRRLLVPADTKLPRLHRLLQAIMGWENYHLHAFHVGEVTYGEPDPDFDDARNVNERRVQLGDIAPKAGACFLYQYDFGDNWCHEVLVEKIMSADPIASYPLCIGGKRACPPRIAAEPGDMKTSWRRSPIRSTRSMKSF